MIRPIMKNILFLSQKSQTATQADMPVAQDLLDTLFANRDACVGMAANMIGVTKRIIVFSVGPMNIAMLNPVIVSKKGAYDTEEGCLSLTGVRPVRRYEEIVVEYTDMQLKKQKNTFSGFTAQIIQHECDHLEGIII